ncbi:MAG: replicative DNA helicase, partial [Casimicrobium sp.]
IVIERARARLAIGIGTDLAEQGYGSGAISESIARAQSALTALEQSAVVRGLENFSFAVTRAVDRIETGAKTLANILPTHDLERFTGAVEEGDLIIVGGRPGMGKSVFLAQSVRRCAKTGKNAAFFSLEMGAEQLAIREIAADTNIPIHELRLGKLPQNKMADVAEAMCRLDSLPILIDDQGGLHVDQIIARCRAAHRRTPLSLIAVDYLQLVQGEGSNRNEMIGDCTRKFKALAKELKCCVMAASQLNRSLEQRADKRPMMSDLRESGEIEQDADLIIFPYRDEEYNPDTTHKGIVEFGIGKFRNGAKGRVYGAARMSVGRFDDLPHGYTVPTPEPRRRQFEANDL